MFVCALDNAGAFDSIPFITLFKKLLSRNMPVFIIRLFVWYLNHLRCMLDGLFCGVINSL